MNMATGDAAALLSGAFLFTAAWFWTLYAVTVMFIAFKTTASVRDL